MDFTSENPIQLVVKAPNQRIADQTVDCMLDWTVRKLKQHLENVYPNKPHKDQQKLIYSGKLLSDHLTLKEILRQFDSEVKHTLHLVCSPAMSSSYESHQAPISTTSPSQETVSSTNPSDGLRYRGQTATESSQITSSPTTAQQPPFPQMAFPTMPPTSLPQMPPGFHPPTQDMYNYTPEQYMWMQQMYMQQYYAHYMQYYQSGFVPAGNIPRSEETATIQPNQENNAVPDRQRDVDQPVRMNAQGGPVIDDDDEIGQWDWLDWVYALCRFMVMISIVYFYSTINRFLIVVLFAFAIYLLRADWFRARRPNRREARDNQENEQPQQQEPQPQQPQRSENDSQESGSEETDGGSETNTTEETKPQEPQTPPEPPRPSTLSIIWSFISTFFTSLIPQPPPAVNAN